MARRVRFRGIEDLRKAIKRAPKALRDEAMKEVRESTRAMHRNARAGFNTAARYASFYHGKAGMQNISGMARRFYRYSISEAQMKGRVGLLSARSNRSVFYLRFFNDGTRNQPARPVHDDAFEAERENYIAAQTRALRIVLVKIFGEP